MFAKIPLAKAGGMAKIQGVGKETPLLDGRYRNTTLQRDRHLRLERIVIIFAVYPWSVPSMFV